MPFVCLPGLISRYLAIAAAGTAAPAVASSRRLAACTSGGHWSRRLGRRMGSELHDFP
jgi:hypothetical protein